ncbi:MAG: hypothetical protein WBV94_17420 [Blastocatellia bacterium]
MAEILEFSVIMPPEFSHDESAPADFLGNEMARNCEFYFSFAHGTPFAIPFAAR